MGVDIEKMVAAMQPTYNHIVVKRHLVKDLMVGNLHIPDGDSDVKGFTSGVWEVISVGEGVQDGEPCPVEVGDFCCLAPQSALFLEGEYFITQWIHVMGRFDKDFARLATSSLFMTAKTHAPW